MSVTTIAFTMYAGDGTAFERYLLMFIHHHHDICNCTDTVRSMGTEKRLEH